MAIARIQRRRYSGRCCIGGRRLHHLRRPVGAGCRLWL